MFWFFDPNVCVILAPQPGIEPTPSALEGKVLTIGPPGKSKNSLLLDQHFPFTRIHSLDLPSTGHFYIFQISTKYWVHWINVIQNYIFERALIEK